MMNKAKRTEHEPINWTSGHSLAVVGTIIIVVFFAVMILLTHQTEKMKATAPCEDFAAWTEPPARCWKYFGGRDR